MKRNLLTLGAAFLLLTPATVLAQHGRPSSPPAGAPASPGASQGKPATPDRPATPATEKGKSNAGKNAAVTEHGKTNAELLTQNTKLASKIQTLTGQDAKLACEGFKNLGQCVAAAHVSQNLGITWDTLKTKMTTGGAKSLGDAIKEINPEVNAKAEAKKAEKQAKADMTSSS